jgi:hypothetical protein
MHTGDEDVRFPKQARVAGGGRKFSRAPRVFAGIDVTHHAAEHVELRERVEAKDVVVETVGKLESGTSERKGTCESLPEPFRKGEADVDAGLEPRV